MLPHDSADDLAARIVERVETIKAIDSRIDELNKQERDLTEQAEQSWLKL